MKKFLLILFLLFISLFVFAKKWTIMLYICGDNNLVGAINGDIDEIENVYTDTTDIDIVIQVDGERYQASSGYNDITQSGITENRRYHLDGNGNGGNNSIDVAPVQSLGELNMSDPQTLIDFATWTKQNYPADNYALIIWNHGAGWGKNSIFSKGGVSDDTDGDFMSGAAGEWRTALAGAKQAIGQNFAFIGHDLCVMAYIEVLWDEYDLTDMIVWSEANEPYYGWYYDSWISNLINNPDASLSSIGQWIVDDYANFYTNIYSSSATMTYNIINEQDVSDLRMAIWNLAENLVNTEGGRDASDVQSCIDATLAMSSGTFYEDFKDLWDFCDNIINNSTINSTAKGYASDIQTLIDNLNPYDWESGFSGSHGLGIYLPDDNNIYSFEATYDAVTHRWGASQAYNGVLNGAGNTWTDFIFGSTSTMMNDISASIALDNNEVIINYKIGNYYDNAILLRNNKQIAVLDEKGTYKDINLNEGKYIYVIKASVNGNLIPVYNQQILIEETKPEIKNGILYTNSKYNDYVLMDISGKKIPPSNINIWQLKTLPEGIYFLKNTKSVLKIFKMGNIQLLLK